MSSENICIFHYLGSVYLVLHAPLGYFMSPLIIYCGQGCPVEVFSPTSCLHSNCSSQLALLETGSHYCHWLITLTSCLILVVLFTLFLFLMPLLFLPLIACPLWFVYGAPPHWQRTMCQKAPMDQVVKIEANHQIHHRVKKCQSYGYRSLGLVWCRVKSEQGIEPPCQCSFERLYVGK